MSDAITVTAKNVGVRFLIRYHRSAAMLRETFATMFERLRQKRRGTDRREFWALEDVTLECKPG